LNSGQVFRWEPKNDWWYGRLPQGIVKIRQEGFSLLCVTSGDKLNPQFVRSYFRLEDDLDLITSSLMKDTHLSEIIQEFYGLRLISQDRWECLLSFVIATNSNIPRIKGMIGNLCNTFGTEMIFEGSSYWLFPSPEQLADAPAAAIAKCGLGYRAPFIKKVAEAVCNGGIDLSELTVLSYPEARNLLLRDLFGSKLLPGVGPKVADCVLLFSCGKNEAFPIDVWIAKTISSHYAPLLEARLRAKVLRKSPERLSLSLKEYDSISGAMRSHFGAYAGFAQQYLYMSAISGPDASATEDDSLPSQKI
jgi:N-glycosylase/DNA lyase